MPKYSPQQIDKLLREIESPRFKSIDQADRYFKGTQYEGKSNFWNTDQPLLDRAPSVIYPVARIATNSITSFCLGDTRFPKISSGTSEDDTKLDPDFTLSTNDSQTLDAVVDKICEQVRLKATARQAMEMGLAQRTVVAVCSVVAGKLSVQMIPSKWVTPKFCVVRPDEVERIEIRYRYKEPVWDRYEREWQDRVFEFLRVIDETSDTTFFPVEIKPKEESIGPAPVPNVPDPTKTFVHGFKFCPVIWYKHLASCSTASDIDGVAIHDGLFNQIDALNYALSARNRAAIGASDPQYWEKGVDPDNAPGAVGQKAGLRPANGALPDGSEWNGAIRGFLGGGSQVARKRGVTSIWSSASPDYEAGILTLPGDALAAISTDAADEQVKLNSAMGVVDIDPTSIAGNISTKTLQLMFARQIATCDTEREDFGRCFLLPLINMLLRIVLRIEKGLYLAGADKVRPILKKFERPVELPPGAPQHPTDSNDPDSNVQWFTPSFTLKWGDYFTPGEEEKAQTVTHTAKAKEAGLITTQMAVENMRGIHKFSDSAQVMEQVKKEKQEEQDQYMQQLKAAKPAVAPKK